MWLILPLLLIELSIPASIRNYAYYEELPGAYTREDREDPTPPYTKEIHTYRYAYVDPFPVEILLILPREERITKAKIYNQTTWKSVIVQGRKDRLNDKANLWRVRVADFYGDSAITDTFSVSIYSLVKEPKLFTDPYPGRTDTADPFPRKK